MKATDEDLKGAVQAATTRDASAREACLAAETLARAAEGALAAAEREPVADHFGACSECAQELRLIAPLQDWAERAVPGRRALSAPGWPAWAAAAVVLLGLAIVVSYRSPPPAPSFRAQGASAIRALTPDGAALPRERCLLRWSSPAAGSRYTLTVALKDLTPLHAVEDLEAPEQLVPPAALAKVPQGGEIVWAVEAMLPDGRRLASPAFIARIR